MTDFVSSGGEEEAYVGLGNGVTSAQAIEQLLFAGAEVWEFDTGGTVLFHPKAYLLQGPGCAWIAVGSRSEVVGVERNDRLDLVDHRAGDDVVLRR